MGHVRAGILSTESYDAQKGPKYKQEKREFCRTTKIRLLTTFYATSKDDRQKITMK